MAKFKTGTIYSGVANVRIVDEHGAHTAEITIGGAFEPKAFDKALRDKWDYESSDGSAFRVCKRISPITKTASKYRVLTSEIMGCPSFEVLPDTEE